MPAVFTMCGEEAKRKKRRYEVRILHCQICIDALLTIQNTHHQKTDENLRSSELYMDFKNILTHKLGVKVWILGVSGKYSMNLLGNFSV